jgi:hypothetical protein
MPNTGRAYSLECVISFVYSERAWAKREWTVYCTAPVNVSACNPPLGPHSREFRLRSGRRDRKVLLAERPARHRIESGRTETPTPKPKPKPKQHTRPFRMHASSTETNPHHCWNTSTGPDPHAAPRSRTFLFARIASDGDGDGDDRCGAGLLNPPHIFIDATGTSLAQWRHGPHRIMHHTSSCASGAAHEIFFFLSSDPKMMRCRSPDLWQNLFQLIACDWRATCSRL